MESRRIKVLVLDNDSGQRQAFAGIASADEFEILEAENRLDAFIQARSSRPDLVVANWDAPADAGRRLLDSLRREIPDYRPYVIATSARSDEETLAAIVGCGVEDVVARPLARSLVLARLRSARRLLGLQRSNEQHAWRLRQYSEELSCTNQRLRELLAIDELTGLPNRRQALEAMRHAWADTGRRLSPLSCLAIEITGLGEINRIHGYERGDVVLKTVAAVLKNQVGSEGVVYRIGGDEFLVIGAGTPLAVLQANGNRLAGTFEALTAEYAHCGLRMGAAHYRPDIPTPQALISLAIEGKSHAKRYRLTRVVCMQESARPPAGHPARPARRTPKRPAEAAVPSTGCLFAVA